MTNLAGGHGASGTRPFQLGRAEGAARSGSGSLSVNVRWLIDTGSEVAVVTKNLGDRFTTTPTGATAGPTTGATAIMMTSGISVEFSATDSIGSLIHIVIAGDVGHKSDNNGSNIVGMDVLDAAGCSLSWDPGRRSGDITL